MSKITVAVGAQGGDEGKGKVVDYISKDYDLVIRFQGGDNAGHTVVNDFGIFHMRLIPSAVFRTSTKCLLGTGMVINPESFIAEMDSLESQGIDTRNIYISSKAHILFPFHVDLDVSDVAMSDYIDTTKHGIGPAYASKCLRDGLRFEDLFDKVAIEHFFSNTLPKANCMLEYFNRSPINEDHLRDKLCSWTSILESRIVEPIGFVHCFIKKHKSILFEGQLGIQRDIDHGQYPYVTSSHPIAAYACVTAGIPISYITDIIGIVRAYPILAGNGPFPTEMDVDTASLLRGSGTEVDDEFGVNTGRPRRIGWPDIPLLQYSNLINGYTALALTKIDKFDSFDQIKVCVSYVLDNKVIDYYPSTREMRKVKPLYRIFKGWKQSTRNAKSFSELPHNARLFIKFIENQLEVPVKYIGTGPHRNNIITVN